MKIWTFLRLVIAAALATFLVTIPVAAQNSAKPKAHKPAEPSVGTVPEDMSPSAAEVVWLYHHNATQDAILHYVNTSHADFKLSVEDVNYLKDIGVPTDIVFAMIRTPKARETVVRLRSHEPMWPAANHPKQEEPQPALENIELRRNQQLENNSENNAVPHYYGPSDNAPAPHPIPPNHYPYGVPPPNYNGFDNRFPHPGEPGYNGPNGYGQPIVPNGHPIVPE